MYIKLTNNVPETYTIRQFRRDNPGISFPDTISEEILSEFNVYPYTEDSRPEFDGLTQKIEESFELRDNSWYKTFTITDLSQEQAETNIRNRRDSLLRETDWMALSDVTLTQPWADYRQELRDITTQESFPYNVVWPTRPE